MTRRPLCLLCLALMLFLCVADRAGLPLIRGNPVPENTASWIEKHPQATVCGEVLQTTENEFTQSIYLSNAYLIYQPKKNQSEKNQSKKISIENVKVFFKKKEEVPVGTVVLVSGKLERVEEKRNPGEFDSQQYYATQHIFYFMKKAEILEKSKNYSVYRQRMNQLREYLGSVLEKISGKESGIFQAIVLGDKSSLDKEVKLRYQVSGIVHVLAISGLHISVVGMGIYNLLMKTGMGIWPSGIISLFLLLQYGIMTGGSVSTMRAVCMFLIAVGAKITGRIYDLPTALAVSAVMIVGDSGAYLYSSGFLLSFSAVVGAGVVVPAITRNGKKKPVLALISSLGVQLTMLPVSLYFFGEVSLTGIFLNLIVLPTVGILLGSGVLGLLTGCANYKVGSVVILPGRILAEVYDELCKLAGNLPIGTWIAGQPRLWQVAVYYVLLAGAVAVLTYKDTGKGKAFHKRKEIQNEKPQNRKIWNEKRQNSKLQNHRLPNREIHSAGKKNGFERNLAGRRITALAVMGIALLILTWRGPEPFSITCLDVGQGDGIILRTPQENCFLVDGGSTNKSGVGQYQILPYLKNQGISRIDGIFVSHTDQDHINGIQEILELTTMNLNSVKIGCLYLPKWKNPPEAWRKLEALAMTAGIPVRKLESGNQLKAGKLRLNVLAPFPEASGSDVNEDGMVILAEYGEFRGLLTGDIGEETEKKLMVQGLLEDVDFLKVGHHGSHYSTCQQFLDTVRPEYAFISCSETNTYGHPSPEVVKRLEEAGSQICFTMKNGAVSVCWEKGEIAVKRYIEG